MFKATLSRQGRLCRLPLTARSVQLASRTATARSFARATQQKNGTPTSCGLAKAWTRQYSAQAGTDDAPAPTHAAESPEDSAITRFADLSSLGVDQKIIDAITKGMGYETMSTVQAMTAPPALAGKDIVAQAKTGTGKTLAFLIPVMQKILNEVPELANRGWRSGPRGNLDIRAIILSPTRELAEQIGVEAKKLARGTGMVVQLAVGGLNKRDMMRRTQQEGCHLLVATPGRLLDLLEDAGSGIDAPNLDAVVLDEADRMLDVGFEQALKDIMRYLPNRNERPRQTFLFSATLADKVVRLAKAAVDPKNFEFVQTISKDDTPTHNKVPQYLVACKGYENVFPALLELCRLEIEKAAEAGAQPFKAIVFLPTTAHVQLAYKSFRYLFSPRSRAGQSSDIPNVIEIHSKLTQARRMSNAKDFRNAKSAILISSDVTARGMDFPNVSHVIQISVPPDRAQYIHRLGRTGRADKEGQGWIFLSEAELPAARRVLYDLPIQHSNDLSAAKVDMTQGETDHQHVRDILFSMAKVDDELKEEMYKASLGRGSLVLQKQQLVDSLNDLAVHGYGLESPPALSERFISNRGFDRVSGLVREARSRGRPQDDDRRSSPREDFGRGSSRDGFGRGPSRDGFGRGPSRDGFGRGSSRNGSGRGSRDGNRRSDGRERQSPWDNLVEQSKGEGREPSRRSRFQSTF